ncbi:MAG: FAD-dependent oxidoreductase, partial [Hymenobacter sp.]
MKATLENANAAPYNVIISGGGPVGLFLAGELALAHCTVLLLEKAASPHSPLKRRPFGIRGLNALSIEALYRRGLLHELALHQRLPSPHLAAPGPPQRQGGHFAGIQFQVDKIDFSQWPYRLPSATATHLLTELAELEPVLTRRAEALGVEIRRGLA